MDIKKIILIVIVVTVVTLFIMHTSMKMKESFVPEMSPFPVEEVVVPGINADSDKTGEMYTAEALAVTGYSCDHSHAEVSF